MLRNWRNLRYNSVDTFHIDDAETQTAALLLHGESLEESELIRCSSDLSPIHLELHYGKLPLQTALV